MPENDHYGQRLSKVEQDVAALSSAVEGIASSVDRIEAQVSRPHTVNWVGIGSLIIAVLGASFLYFEARLGPVTEMIRDNRKWVDERSKTLVSDYKEFGQTISQGVHNEQLIMEAKSRIHDLEQMTAKHDGLIEMMREQIHVMNTMGSVTWNKRLYPTLDNTKGTPE